MPEIQRALTQRRERNDCGKAKRSPLSPDVFHRKSKSYKSGDNSDCNNVRSRSGTSAQFVSDDFQYTADIFNIAFTKH
ncbi:hypothetical protein BK136_24980 [Paenibacillus amylolyticus]|nr:hypothetical protein BK136_24980 [Paenibacillus amylolyticus]